MARKPASSRGDQPDSRIRDPDEWTTGDEPLTKAEASKRIDELQDRTGRGRGTR
jgi:hypothetical protein